MPFFQNPFTNEFRGHWVLGDRQHVPTFIVPPNAGRGPQVVIIWGEGPFDLSGNDLDGDPLSDLTIRYALRNEKIWSTMTIDISASAASASAVTTDEIAMALNANATFSSRFVATPRSDIFKNGKPRLSIRQRVENTEFRFYIVNGGAEQLLRFNKMSGIAELPSYFARHTVTDAMSATSHDDGANLLIQLDMSNDVDAHVVDTAVDSKYVSKGFSSAAEKDDWELLGGKSGIFNFKKLTVDDDDRIVQIIEYPAGAAVGDFARKTLYEYTGENKNPDQITEIPHTLVADDLVTPAP